MKKIVIVFLCIFINFGICFSAEFKDLSLSNAIKQSGKLYEYELETFSDDPTFNKDFENNNKLFKEFFQKLPGNFSAYPIVGNGSIFKYSGKRYENFKYVVAVETQNFHIQLYDAQVDDKGIHGYAQILVNIDAKSFAARKIKKPYLILSFTDFYILNDGSFESGRSDDQGVNSYSSGENIYVVLEKVSLQKEKDKYLIVAQEPRNNRFFSGNWIKLGKTIFSTDAKIISTEPYTQEQIIENSEKHCTIKCNNSYWDGKKFSIDLTSVYLPALNTSFDKENFDISLNKSDVLIKAKNKKDKVNMFDYPFTMDYLTIDQDNLRKVTIKNAVIYFGQNSLQLGNLNMQLQTENDWGETIEIAYMEKPVSITNRKDKIRILDENDIVYEYEFDSLYGLMLTFETSFPNQQSNRSRYEVDIDKDGVVWSGKRCSSYFEKTYSFDKTVLEGTFCGIHPDYGFQVNDASLKFPENSILDGIFLSNYYSIRKDGTLSADIRYIPFFDLGNIYIDSQYFTKDGLVLSGRIAWADIVELQGLLDYLQIEKMYVGFDGLIKEFKLKESEGSYGTTLASDWYISNNEYSLQINQTKDKDGNLSPVEILLSFDDCKMFPPKASTVDAIPVKNLKYRLKGNSMGFVYDDAILPEGTKIDFAKVFEKKQYNPKDTIRVSAREVAEISNMLDQECVDLQRKKLFKLSEEYEYDQKGNVIHEVKANDDGKLIDYYYEYDSNGNRIVSRYKNNYDEPQEMRYEYDDKGRITKRINVITGYEGRSEYDDYDDGYTERFYRKEAGQKEEKLSSTSTVYLNKDGKKTGNSSNEKWIYDDRGNLIEYGKGSRNEYKAREKWVYNEQNQLIQYDYDLATSYPNTEKYEYYDGLLCSKIYKNGNTGNIQLYSYDNNNRLIKITTKYLRIDKWYNFRENGTGTPQYFKYNEYGELAAEKNYNFIKTYSYEHYPNGQQKSKRVYIYRVPNSDM